MKRAILALVAVLLVMPSTSIFAQEELQLTVANWSFEVLHAVKAPMFTDVIHLGAVDDGRDWLVVTLRATNTSDDDQEIHSDNIQLTVANETIKQTGSETESAAKELERVSIGGSFPHDTDAGEVLEIVQVYKVDPDAEDFTLEFDFSGKWEISINALVESSAGNAGALLGVENSESAIDAPDTQSGLSITTANFRLRLIGAVVAPTFTGAFHLGMTDDGRSWLVVSYRLENTSSNEIEIASESISILSGGEVVRQAGDETRSVAAELDLVAPTLKLGANDEVNVVQAFKIDPDTVDNTLQVSSAGEWFLNLRPVVEASNGNAEAVIPGAESDFAEIAAESDTAQVVPTPAPTPTPEPTPLPEPTEPPRRGSENAPAALGETLELDGLSVTLQSGFYAYEYNFGTPKGGYMYLIVEVRITNVSDGKISYNPLYFAAKDMDTDVDYDDTFAILDTPLEAGELSPGEFVYGQVALEVQETATNVRVKYTVNPGLFGLGGSEALYWFVPR